MRRRRAASSATEKCSSNCSAPRMRRARPPQVEMRGSSRQLDKVGHTVELAGPATALSSGQQVTAGQFTLWLDAEFRAQTLVAAPGPLNQQPEVKNHGAKGDSTLRGDK